MHNISGFYVYHLEKKITLIQLIIPYGMALFLSQQHLEKKSTNKILIILYY